MPASAVSRSIGLQTIGIESDMQVNAPSSSTVLEFPVPRTARMQSATATLSITPGPQLNSENIFFFYYNDQQIATRTAKELRQQKTFVLNLPVDKVVRDSLRLQIKSNLFISDDWRRDLYSGGMFFTLNKETKINLNYELLPVRSVADFFGNFQQSLLIVVPNEAGLSEMMPAVWVYGILKKNYPHLDIQVVKARDTGNRPATPRIWVGLRDRLPAYFAKTNAGIALADANTLLLSAGHVTELESLVMQLPDLPVFPPKSAGSRKIVIQTVPNSSEKNQAGLEGISFGNQAAQDGELQVSSEFLLYPSLLGSVPEKLGLHLEGSHMVSVEQIRPARLDVFFNSSLVHSSALDQTGRFSRDIVLPEGTELLTRNSLSLHFNYPEEQGQCRGRGKTQSAQVFPSSYLWGSGQQKMNLFTWSNVGIFFGRQGTVLVDEKLSDNPLNLLASVVGFLNQQLPTGSYAFPMAQTLAGQAFIPTDQYVFALSMAGNLPSYLQELQENMSSLPLGHQPDANTVIGKIADNNGFPVVVLSTNQKGTLLADALRYLNHPVNYSKLVGNTLTFRQPGLVYSQDFRDNERKPITAGNAAPGMGSRFWEQHKKEVAIGGAVVLGVIMLVVYFGLFRKRKISG